MGVTTYKTLFVTGLIAVAGIVAASMPLTARAATPEMPVLTSPTEGQEVNKGFVKFSGTGPADHDIIVKVNGHRRMPNQTINTGSEGEFTAYMPIRNKINDKQLNVKVYAKNTDTKELSEPATLLVYVPLVQAKRTYTAEAVRNECKIEGNSYERIEGVAITAWVTTKHGKKVYIADETTSDSNGDYELDLPRRSNIRVVGKKDGYTTGRYSTDLAVNATNGNINKILYLCRP